jgi:hypothetical protein
MVVQIIRYLSILSDARKIKTGYNKSAAVVAGIMGEVLEASI